MSKTKQKAKKKPENRSFTISTRLGKQKCGELIEYFNQYRVDFGRMQRFVWRYILWHQGSYHKSSFNTLLQNKFGILKRTANSLISDMQGRYNALRELKKTELAELKIKIKALEKQIAQLDEKVSKLAKQAAKNKLDAKKLKTYRDKKKSLFKKRQKLNKLKNRSSQREKNIQNGVYKLGFGTKKLFKAQYHLKENGFKSHQGWYNEFVRRRDCNIFYLGTKAEKFCNQLVRLTPVGNGYFEFEVRKDGKYSPQKTGNNPIRRKDKYLIGCCTFKYLTEEIEEALTKLDRAVSYRIVFRGKKFYLQAMLSLNMKKRSIRTREKFGVIGLDFNSGHIDLSEIDEHGNLVHMTQYPLKFHGTGSKAKNEMRTVISKIGEYALSVGKSIIKEELSFLKKKATTLPAKTKKGKKYNRMLHTLDYNCYHESMNNMCIRNGIVLIDINPAYTSRIAKQKYCSQRKLPEHNGAAYVIARRGRGFKDKLQKSEKTA